MERVPIEAYIRIRPGEGVVRYTEKSVVLMKECVEMVEYEFDGVFGPESTQSQVVDVFQCIIPRLMSGYNQTLFCYGNTGAGKTYTMVGDNESRGLMYNLVEEILRHGGFVVSYMEIYNEKIYDLLEPKELLLREMNGNIIIPNLFSKRIVNMSEFVEIFERGTSNRTTAETKLNKSSSRSHGILRIGMGESKLHLIDLAGSENNRKTGNVGLRLMESTNINRSLFVLGKVVNAVLKGEKRIPYRDSKLTRLLQDSIGGSSLCYIIANINDTQGSIGDSTNTLSFASKSRSIINTSRFGEMRGRKEMEKNREPLSLKKFNVMRTSGVPFRRIREGKEAVGLYKNPLDSCSVKRLHDDGVRSDGMSIILSPHTKEKSYRAFLKRAQEFEEVRKYRLALEDYKTVQKFCDNDFIRNKIEMINGLMKKKRKMELSRHDVLNILNSGNFIDIKKLPKVGDKRAQIIVDFISGGNLFMTLDDLRLLFSEKIVNSMLLPVCGIDT